MSTLPAVVVGTGSTVAVLLHQTDQVALCGWWPYANWLTAEADVQALMFDLCGFGDAACPDGPFAADQIGQVELAVAHARDQGATRIVLVGASMGGSIALDAAVAVRADAVVDLSGPVTWRELSAERIAPELTLATLIAVSPDDNYDRLASEALFPTIPATDKKLVIPDSGHGWDMLEADDMVTPLATTVKGWILGETGREDVMRSTCRRRPGSTGLAWSQWAARSARVGSHIAHCVSCSSSSQLTHPHE